MFKMNLLNILKNPEMRKIFGKRELKIIEKQILGIKLKPSEITRLSRDIRKKFDAIKELSPYTSEFKLKKGSRIKEIIKDSKEVIMNSSYLPKIKRIVLFGSAAKNKLDSHSDIDIAVDFKEINQEEAGKFRLHILSRVSDMVDIQVYNFLPGKIKEQIDKGGKILYERQIK